MPKEEYKTFENEINLNMPINLNYSEGEIINFECRQGCIRIVKNGLILLAITKVSDDSELIIEKINIKYSEKVKK